jgi:hypothetical protein
MLNLNDEKFLDHKISYGNFLADCLLMDVNDISKTTINLGCNTVEDADKIGHMSPYFYIMNGSEFVAVSNAGVEAVCALSTMFTETGHYDSWRTIPYVKGFLSQLSGEGIGKTRLAVSLAFAAAVFEPTLYITAEIRETDFVALPIVRHTHQAYRKLTKLFDYAQSDLIENRFNIAAGYSCSEHIEQIRHVKPSFAVIDSINGAIETASETPEKIIKRYQDAAREYNCHILLLEQTGLCSSCNEKPSVLNFIDQRFELDKCICTATYKQKTVKTESLSDQYIILSCKKNRIGETGKKLIFENKNRPLYRGTLEQCNKSEFLVSQYEIPSDLFEDDVSLEEQAVEDVNETAGGGREKADTKSGWLGLKDEDLKQDKTLGQIIKEELFGKNLFK